MQRNISIMPKYWNLDMSYSYWILQDSAIIICWPCYCNLSLTTNWTTVTEKTCNFLLDIWKRNLLARCLWIIVYNDHEFQDEAIFIALTCLINWLCSYSSFSPCWTQAEETDAHSVRPTPWRVISLHSCTVYKMSVERCSMFCWRLYPVKNVIYCHM